MHKRGDTALDYTTEWLHDLRLQHSTDTLPRGKLQRIDYAHLERVLLMRRDLMEGWARRVEGPLNAFDVFLLSLDIVNAHENVAKAVATETQGPVPCPSWLTQDRLAFLCEKYPQLLPSAVDYSRASFEDFQGDGEERVRFTKDLIDTSTGQVELGLFLGKGLIAKDDDYYRLALEYLASAMPFCNDFPQVLDAIVTGISHSGDARRCSTTGQAVCAALASHPGLAERLADRLMEGIQREHLTANQCSSLQLSLCCSSPEWSVRVTRYLPTWLMVLGSCLASGQSGAKQLYTQIDLLLLLPFHCDDPDDVGLACEWLRALITVFSADRDNEETLKSCAKRFVQLIDLEQQTRVAEIDCGAPTRALLAELLDTGVDAVSMASCSECSHEHVCQLTPNVLSLLKLPCEPIKEGDDDDKGKDKGEGEEGGGGGGVGEGNRMGNIMGKVYDRIIDLMHEWIKLGIAFDASWIPHLAQRSEAKALKLLLAYEKRFGVFPVDLRAMEKATGLEWQLLSLLSTADSGPLHQLIGSSCEDQLKGCQEIVVKLLAKHPRLAPHLVDRFPDSVWAVKAAWSSMTAASASPRSLSETLECLLAAKSLIDWCVDRKGDVEVLVILIRNVRLFLNSFEEQCLPGLSASFGTSLQAVLSVLKGLQSCTRPMQAVCAGSKTTTPELASLVPALKKALESVLFKVKILLKDNACLSAFWMGNLRDKAATD